HPDKAEEHGERGADGDGVAHAEVVQMNGQQQARRHQPGGERRAENERHVQSEEEPVLERGGDGLLVRQCQRFAHRTTAPCASMFLTTISRNSPVMASDGTAVYELDATPNGKKIQTSSKRHTARCGVQPATAWYDGMVKVIPASSTDIVISCVPISRMRLIIARRDRTRYTT